MRGLRHGGGPHGWKSRKEVMATGGRVVTLELSEEEWEAVLALGLPGEAPGDTLRRLVRVRLAGGRSLEREAREPGSAPAGAARLSAEEARQLMIESVLSWIDELAGDGGEEA